MATPSTSELVEDSTSSFVVQNDITAPLIPNVCPRCGNGRPCCAEYKTDGVTRFTHEETCATYDWVDNVCHSCEKVMAEEVHPTNKAKGSGIQVVTRAIDFAAKRYTTKFFKGLRTVPYINHLIEVARVASEIGGVIDYVILAACVLKDTINDKETSHEELIREFGHHVADVVFDISKCRISGYAESVSFGAKTVMLCDIYCKLRNITTNTPAYYKVERVQGHCVRAHTTVDYLRGTNLALEKLLDESIFRASFVLDGQTHPCCPTNFTAQ